MNWLRASALAWILALTSCSRVSFSFSCISCTIKWFVLILEVMLIYMLRILWISSVRDISIWSSLFWLQLFYISFLITLAAFFTLQKVYTTLFKGNCRKIYGILKIARFSDRYVSSQKCTVQKSLSCIIAALHMLTRHLYCHKVYCMLTSSTYSYITYAHVISIAIKCTACLRQELKATLHMLTCHLYCHTVYCKLTSRTNSYITYAHTSPVLS